MAAIARKQGSAMASNLVKTLIRSPNRPVSSPLSSLHKLRFITGVVNSEVTISHTAKWMQVYIHVCLTLIILAALFYMLLLDFYCFVPFCYCL